MTVPLQQADFLDEQTPNHFHTHDTPLAAAAVAVAVAEYAAEAALEQLSYALVVTLAVDAEAVLRGLNQHMTLRREHLLHSVDVAAEHRCVQQEAALHFVFYCLLASQYPRHRDIVALVYYDNTDNNPNMFWLHSHASQCFLSRTLPDFDQQSVPEPNFPCD